MARPYELARWLWLEAQLGAPPFVQHTLIPWLHHAKEIVRLLTQPYMRLYELKGYNQAGPLTVTYGGLGYAAPTLKSLLFLDEPVEREIGRVPVWSPGRLLDATTGDLAIVEASQYLIRQLPGQGAIRLPFRLRFVLDIQGDWEEIQQRFHRNLRDQIRKAGRYEGYEYEISQREEDLDMFYHSMYLPYVEKRHGKLAAILPEREAYQLLRHGWLFLVKRDGIHVCGSLGYARRGCVDFIEMGVLHANQQLMKDGVVEAMNYLRMRWAHQEGYKTLDLGGSWPYMSGIFQAKRKWGATMGVAPHEQKQIWIRIQADTPAVSRFLESNPCVVMNSRGELHGLIVTADPENIAPETEATWRKLYETPGLSGLLIHSPKDLMERRDGPS